MKPIVWQNCKELNIVKNRYGLIACAAAVMLTTAACGSSSGEPAKAAKPSVSVDASLRAKLPTEVKDSGVIKSASDATYPPMEFKAHGTDLTGFDIDLGNAIAKVLGVKMQWTNLSAASIIPGLENGRFDVALTSAQDTPERQAVFDFVDYMNIGSDLIVAAGNPTKISDFKSLCGKRLGVQSGTTQLADAQKRQADCGSDKIDIQSFPTNDAANLALSSGRVDAVYAQSPVNAYVVDQSNKRYEVVGEPYEPTLVGAVLPKGSKLVDAFEGAAKKLVEDGTYADLVKKWNLESSAVHEITVNGG